MTARISKLRLSSCLASILLMGCAGKASKVVHKCQLVVVLDKTNSVNFSNKLPYIQSELTRNFNETYAASTKGIQTSLLVVTGTTSVFPKPNRFGSDLEEGEEDSRDYQQRLLRWTTAKRQWMSDRVQEVVAKIDTPCRSNNTDIFSVFDGITQVQKNDGPWDSIVVMIFSDMVNTCGPINLEKKRLLPTDARAKGREICTGLIASGRISTNGIGNLYLRIYTPDGMTNTAMISQFWAGFFEQWGLKPEHYRFE